MSIPNMITWSRLLLIFPFMLLMAWEFPTSASIVFAVGAISDFFDGYIARKYKQSTKFGEIFDPIVDKLFYLSVLIMFLHFRYIGVWPVIIIVFREIFITGMRSACMCLGKQFPSDSFGKVKATLQYLSFFVILYFHKSIYSSITIWSVAIITIGSSFNYMIRIYECVKAAMNKEGT